MQRDTFRFDNPISARARLNWSPILVNVEFEISSEKKRQPFLYSTVYTSREGIICIHRYLITSLIRCRSTFHNSIFSLNQCIKLSPFHHSIRSILILHHGYYFSFPFARVLPAWWTKFYPDFHEWISNSWIQLRADPILQSELPTNIQRNFVLRWKAFIEHRKGRKKRVIDPIELDHTYPTFFPTTCNYPHIMTGNMMRA